MPFRRGCQLLCGGIIALLGAGATFCFAQEGKVLPSTPGNPYTLHVYPNLVQVPTMVLNEMRSTEVGLRPESFKVRLDDGPGFHPVKARPEGDDPLDIAVLVDATSAVAPSLLNSFAQALEALPGGLLTEEDHVQVYAVDCALVRARSNRELPTTREELTRAMTAVAGNLQLHGAYKVGRGCDRSRKLWDSVAAVAGDLKELPGRRILLVLSDGTDYGSTNSWNRVRVYVSGLGISIFGIRSGLPPIEEIPMSASHRTPWMHVAEEPFSLLCGGTGGLVLDAEDNTVATALERTIRLIRERYILEFQRPRNGTAGFHLLEVRVPDQRAIVRPGGVLVRLLEPSIKNDPSTVPTDDTHAPLLGSRKILPPSK